MVYPGPPATVGIGVEGTLGIDADSLCVTLTDEAGRSRVVAFSEEAGATIDLSDPVNPAVVADGCRPLRDGDHVQFYGMGTFPDRGVLKEHFEPNDLYRCGTTIEDLELIGYCDGPSRP